MNNPTFYFQKVAIINEVFKIKIIALVYLKKTCRLQPVRILFLVKTAQRNTRSCNCPTAHRYGRI